jgi:hypothetical protein
MNRFPSKFVLWLIFFCSYLCIGCDNSCERRFLKLVGAVPTGARLVECKYTKYELPGEYNLEASIKSGDSFELVASALRVKYKNLSLEEGLRLGDWGRYSEIIPEGPYEKPRGAIRIDRGYLVVVQESEFHKFRVTVVGKPRFGKSDVRQ